MSTWVFVSTPFFFLTTCRTSGHRYSLTQQKVAAKLSNYTYVEVESNLSSTLSFSLTLSALSLLSFPPTLSPHQMESDPMRLRMHVDFRYKGRPEVAQHFSSIVCGGKTHLGEAICTRQYSSAGSVLCSPSRQRLCQRLCKSHPWSPTQQVRFVHTTAQALGCLAINP
jgi:hypothetical protein